MSIFKYVFIHLMEVVVAYFDFPPPLFSPSDTDCCISTNPCSHSVRMRDGAAL